MAGIDSLPRVYKFSNKIMISVGPGIITFITTHYYSLLPHYYSLLKGFPGSSAGEESTCNAGDPGLIPGSEISSEERIGYPLQYSWASLVAQLVKEIICNVGDLGSIPGLERSPGGRHGKPPPFLPGESPWTEEPGGLQSMESKRVVHN